MIDITHLAKNLVFLEEGIWVSKDTRDVSYPEEGYDNNFELEERSFWFMHRNDCIIETLRRFPPSGIVYDVGGGNGYVTKALMDNGYGAILVEPGIEGARNAKSRGLRPIICSTLQGAGFNKKSMPSIGLFDVLEHINDDVEFLKELNSFMVPSGRLYVTVPAYHALWSAEDDFAGHYRRYTLKELRNKLRSAGFEIEYSTYFFTLLTLPIFLFRVIPSRIGLRKRSEFSRYDKEHIVKTKFITIPFQKYLTMELGIIKHGRIRFGASCLIVARVKNE